MTHDAMLSEDSVEERQGWSPGPEVQQVCGAGSIEGAEDDCGRLDPAGAV
jgi:hypothetical protein